VFSVRFEPNLNTVYMYFALQEATARRIFTAYVKKIANLDL
jgi:hypothetical protein